MKAQLKIKCLGCLKDVGAIKMDTADMPEDLQQRVNHVILNHRKDCKYYRN
ncbi:MAG: hypothetical protein PHD09_06570 [Candidatus Omnitrophica bacterium]|jgi:hypothetical protein|nr:hypothetical protein [Candidatus Omnitrophota bacterium]